MRALNSKEENRLALLTSMSVEVALIEPTGTGLKKSILDATSPVRRHLMNSDIHDYDYQQQGPEHKIIADAFLLEENLIIPSQVSLYRPVTKRGDPRIWFKNLPAYAEANDILAIIIHEHKLHVINVTRIPLDEIIDKSKAGPIWELLSEISRSAHSISDELLQKLRKIALSGPVMSVTEENSDTAIGRTLETILGIKINSKKGPDYKGIELKSFRKKSGTRETRKTLFAQVANWELSSLKSSKEILEHFGYNRGGNFKLYCTVSAKKRNSQGLQFKLDSEMEKLIENSDRKDIGDFAVWLMEDLRKRLLEKHNETFWVSASSKILNGREHFQFNKVLHTRKPIPTQFDILVEQGLITMDHLIKRKSNGSVSEKGPLFKIETNSLEMLFPPSRIYNLFEEVA